MSLQFHAVESLKERLIHIDDEVREAIKRVDELEKIGRREGAKYVLEKADEIKALKRTWPREMIARAGDRLMEECRFEAVAKGIAIDNEREAAIGD